ncbi:YgcG family protein [Paenibacillus sp. J2TS4]|uniref:TPM domain-containing protein n=1 Tax=Paenibacillus sp. J2TS4 TaxID=2807194 RepID=UPI0020BE5814|nr:TPM domain-containing protein [Paenibacillus sp. J2TS4]
MACFLLLCCLFVSPLIALAADIPGKNGTVQDLAGMFRDEALASLEQSAQGPLYSFYILTINSLNGEDPSEYATQVFNGWELEDKEILLLIASQEQRIEMNFVNDDLLRAIRSVYGEDGESGEVVGQLTMEHFIPAAKEGDFAQASLDLMEAVHQLPQPELGGSTSVPPDSARTEVPVQEPSSANTGDPEPVESRWHWQIQWSWTELFLYFSLAVIAFIVLYGTLLKFQWFRLRTQVRRLLVEVSHGNDALRPFVGLVQGQTEKVVNQLNDQLTQLLIDLGKLQTDLEPRIFLLKLKTLRQGVRKGQQQLKQSSASFAEVHPGVTRVVEVDRSVTNTVQELSGQLDALESEVKQLAEKHSFPLTRMFEEKGELEADLNQVRDLKVFDPLEANEAASRLLINMGKAVQGAKEFPQMLEKYSTFPQTVSDCRREIEQIVASNSLKLLRMNPYFMLEEAKQCTAPLFAELQIGSMEKVRKIVEQMDSLLAKALEMTKRQAFLRHKNKKDIEYIEQKLAQFAAEGPALDDLLADMQKRFVQEHWADLAVGLQAAKGSLRDTTVKLPEVIRLTDDDHQEFEEARESIDVMLRCLAEMDQTAQGCRTTSRQLNEAIEYQRRDADLNWKHYMDAVQLVKRKGLRFSDGMGAEQAQAIIHDLFQKLNFVLNTPPYSMDEIERHAKQISSQSSAFITRVRRALEEKDEALRSLSQMQSRYRSIVSKTRKKISIKSYDRRYNSIINQVENLITAGHYFSAVEQVNTIRGITNEMEREYSRKLSAERAAASSSSWGSSSSGSSSGSFWGSSSSSSRNSSGGSSWGSGSSGNSSGGSSWRSSSSSRNHSGGSSWGSGSNKNNKSGGSNW